MQKYEVRSKFTNLSLAFLSINKLTKHYKINNLHFSNLIILSDFMHVLNSIRKHYAKDEYFPKHILFTTIYLLQEQKLNPNKYSEKDINLRNFVQATKNGVHMHAKVQGLILHVFFN
jgi:hypothetical protein